MLLEGFNFVGRPPQVRLERTYEYYRYEGAE